MLTAKIMSAPKIMGGAVLALAAVTTGVAVQSERETKSYSDIARSIPIFEKAPVLSRSMMERQLAATPLQPELAYGLVAARVHERKARELTEQERRTLESYGWRSSVIQMALLQDAMNRKDELAVLARIDGLLRRGKLTDQLVAILIKIEQAGPAVRAQLVDLLLERPVWRKSFLIEPAGTTGRPALLARAATIDAMVAKGLNPTREELAPVVNGLSAAGIEDRAASLWRQFHRAGRRTPLPFDGNFVQLAADPQDGVYQAMPYEWHAEHGAGYSARATAISRNSASLLVRWNGRGLPTFLRQKLIAEPGASYQIVINGPLLDKGMLQRIGFATYCEGKPSFYDRLSQLEDGSIAYRSTDRNRCQYPELRLIGMSEDSLSPLELEFSSVRITKTSDTVDREPSEVRSD